jgi:hypothetical protein
LRGNRDVLRSVAANNNANFSNSGFLHAIRRSANDSILAESLGVRKDIPRPMFQQLIAKASAEVKRRLQQERPDLFDEIQSSVIGATGALQSKFGPATERYFAAKRLVTNLHELGELDESVVFKYAQSRKHEEVVVGLSLLCSLPAVIVERALAGTDMTLILAKANEFRWDTAMALLFLGAKDYRLKSDDLLDLEKQFNQLSVKTSLDVLNFFQSRKDIASVDLEERRLPQLYSV